MTLVMIVDDVPTMAEQYAYDLKRIGGYEVITEGEGRRALERLGGEAVDCVILDLEMPGMDGFEVLRALERKGSEVPVIVYTGTGNFDRCIQAIRLGADGFIDKAEPMERVVHEIESAIERRRLRAEVAALERRLEGESSLVGTSAPMAQAQGDDRAGGAGAEHGAGDGRERNREGAGGARSPPASARIPTGPFVAINCAALPEHADRERAVRPRARRVHRRDGHAEGRVRVGREGDALSGRDRRAAARVAGQAAARAGGAEGDAARRHPGARRWRRESSRPPTATCRRRSRRDGSARISTTGSTSSRSTVPPLRDRLSDVPEIASRFVAGDLRAVRHAEEEARGRDARPAHGVRVAAEQRARASEHRRADDHRDRRRGDRARSRCRPRSAARRRARGGEPRSTSFQDQREEAERRIVIAALERNGWQITKTAAELELADHASLLKIMRRLGIQRP